MAGLLAKLWSLVRSKEIVGRDKTGNVFYRQSIRSDGLGKLYYLRTVNFITEFLCSSLCKSRLIV